MDENYLQRTLKLIRGEGGTAHGEGCCEVSETEKADVELLDA